MMDVVDIECVRLHEFVDGELGEEDAERFRMHLADCDRCAAEMPRLLELMAASEDTEVATRLADAPLPPATPMPSPANAAPRSIENARASRRRRYFAAAGLVVAAAVLVFYVLPSTPEHSQTLSAAKIHGSHTLLLADSRPLEVRFSYAGAAAYRPYDVPRGDKPYREVSYERMAELQHAGDSHGLGVAALLRGERTVAAKYLELAPRSAAVDTDRAALWLVDGSETALEQALFLLDGVLAAEPDHIAAHWNRALALAHLELPLAAAREFDRVAAANEPGWSDEAVERASRLRAAVKPRRSAWEETKAAGKRWIAGERPISPPRNAPRGLLRYAFYDAVRAAGSRKRALDLLPLAEQLDRLYGGNALARYVGSVAAADFDVRAPLAEEFRDVRLGTAKYDAKRIEELAAKIRAAEAIDVWMGLVSWTYTIDRHIVDYRTAAAATGDPWFAVLAEHEEAKRKIAAGDRLDGERRLLQASARAAREGLEYRRLLVELSISELYQALRRFSEAERHARAARVEAQAAGEWGIENHLLHQLAETSRFRYAGSLSRAYLAEALERDPDSCQVQRFVHQSLANVAMMALDTTTARRELEAAPLCDEPLQLLAAMTWADLYRFRGTGTEARQVREGLAALRSGHALDAGQLAMADHIEGRLVIETDRATGRALLRKAIEASAGRTDDWSIKARAHSFSILALDAGREGEHRAVLALLAEELGSVAPARCTVGVAIEDERAIVVVRGPDGAVAGEYTGGRTSPRIDAASLVPAALVRRLDGCEDVAVLARPPVLGTARLLPDTLAWSYRLGSVAVQRRVVGHQAHLVIADTNPPAHLELPPLFPHAAAPDAQVLRGPAATPGRVSTAMRDATIIEFHTHGFIDRGLSDASYLALTPDAGGRYALTAADVRAAELRGSPLVILSACHAATGAPFVEEGIGLPLAFMRAGARAVIASSATVSDANADEFFGAVLARIDMGISPAIAVRDERLQRLRRSSESTWFLDVIVYQ